MDEKFICSDCGSKLKFEDTTYSNINTDRASKGQKTGDIYWCDKCECFWINDYLDGNLNHGVIDEKIKPKY